MPSNGAESRKREYNGCVRDECWASSVAIIIETFLKRRALEIYFSNKPIFYRFDPLSILSIIYTRVKRYSKWRLHGENLIYRNVWISVRFGYEDLRNQYPFTSQRRVYT